jgi:hypothetical protein
MTNNYKDYVDLKHFYRCNDETFYLLTMHDSVLLQHTVEQFQHLYFSNLLSINATLPYPKKKMFFTDHLSPWYKESHTLNTWDLFNQEDDELYAPNIEFTMDPYFIEPIPEITSLPDIWNPTQQQFDEQKAMLDFNTEDPRPPQSSVNLKPPKSKKHVTFDLPAHTAATIPSDSDLRANSKSEPVLSCESPKTQPVDFSTELQRSSIRSRSSEKRNFKFSTRMLNQLLET